MKKEEAIQKAIEKAQNECDLLFYPVVCEANVIDGAEEISSAVDNYQKKLAEHTDMWIICEMAKRWLEYLRDKKESNQEWIPCSERLPEEHHLYLTTIKKANGITFTSHSYFFTKEVGWSDACVIAWMPLPEPYKRGEAK